MRKTSVVLLAAITALGACAAEVTSTDADIEDGENDSIGGGKADGPAEGTPAALAILELVNDPGVSEADFDNDAGLSERVATLLATHRDGEDRTFGTEDDNPFNTLAELDAVPYVGAATINRLGKYAERVGSPVKLRFRVVVEVDGERELIAESNDTFAEHGFQFPETLELGPRDGAQMLRVLANVEKASEVLGSFVDFDYTWDPGDYVDLCYTGGDVEKIGNTIEGLRESVFSIYMGIQAERYRDFKRVYVGDEREWLEMQRDENGSDDQVDTWESYDTSSDTYLMMTDGGQQGDGTEFFAVQIPKCD